MSTPESKVIEVHRLSPESYKALEQTLPKPVSGGNNSAEYLLGIQYVLTVLRNGYVSGR